MAAPALPRGMPSRQQPEATETQPGPNQDQMAASAQMPDGDRKQMTESMVAKLAVQLRNEPNDLEGRLRLGRSYGVLGETDKSVAAFEHAATLKPDDPDIRLQEFQAMIAKLKPSEQLPPRAVALLRQVAAMAPDQPEVLWYLGVEAAHSGHVDEARRDWTKLLGLLPADGEDAKLVQTALDTLPK